MYKEWTPSDVEILYCDWLFTEGLRTAPPMPNWFHLETHEVDHGELMPPEFANPEVRVCGGCLADLDCEETPYCVWRREAATKKRRVDAVNQARRHAKWAALYAVEFAQVARRLVESTRQTDIIANAEAKVGPEEGAK